ncbi:MAG: hypothetical protein ORO03_09895, partial [Alphaproteobacteria bacterium]|nr:hypothetical protein [Alphaproteobacteria bacterium]
MAAGRVDTPEAKADLKARLRGRVQSIHSSDIRYFYQQKFWRLTGKLFNRKQSYNPQNIANLSVDLLYRPLLSLVITYPQLGAAFLEQLSQI